MKSFRNISNFKMHLFYFFNLNIYNKINILFIFLINKTYYKSTQIYLRRWTIRILSHTHTHKFNFSVKQIFFKFVTTYTLPKQIVVYVQLTIKICINHFDYFVC